MKNSYLFLLVLTFAGLFFPACSDDEDVVVKQTQVTVTLTMPEGLDGAALKTAVLSLKNITTGRTLSPELPQPLENSFVVTVDEGLYEVALEAEIAYAAANGESVSARAKGYKGNVQLTGEVSSVGLDLFLQQDKRGFVLAEIYVSGTSKEADSTSHYKGDQYFVIYNNSDSVLYADGLAVAESKFLTTTKHDYTPDIMPQAVAVQTLYRISGSGKEYPVEPGQSLLLCDVGKNHKGVNSKSFDLSRADFEWFDESSSASNQDENTPVADLDKIYSYSKTLWIPSIQANRTYVLARVNVTTDEYLAGYKYDYSYVSPVNGNVMNQSCYRIPNDWILDAVNMSPRQEFVWIVTSPSLDMGYTYCHDAGSDKKQFGKSVRRRVESKTAGGRAILRDTNDSGVDFELVKADPYYSF